MQIPAITKNHSLDRMEIFVANNNTSVSTTDTSLNTSTATTTANVSAYTLIYNTWGNWAPKFANDKLLLAFNALLGNTSGTAGNINGTPSSANVSSTWYGAGAYAKYQFNDWFSLCSRGEYLGSNNSLITGNNGSATTPSTDTLDYATGESNWEYTITAGFNVIDNLLIRAEYRLDWGSSIYNTGSSTSTSSGPAHYAGAEVVYSF